MTENAPIAGASMAHPHRTNPNDTSSVNSTKHGANSLTVTNAKSSEKLFKAGFAQHVATSFMSRFRNENAKTKTEKVPPDQRAIEAEMRSSIYLEMHGEIENAWIHAKSAGIDSCEYKEVEIIRNVISHQIDNMATKYKEAYDRTYKCARSSPENFVLASLLSAHKPALAAVKKCQKNMLRSQETCAAAISIFEGEMRKAIVKFVGCHINDCEAIATQKPSIENFGDEPVYDESVGRSSISSEAQAIQPEDQAAAKTFTDDGSWKAWAKGDESQFGGSRIDYTPL